MYDPLKNLDIKKKDPIVLGIESSCDETAAAVVKGRKILSDEIASSANIQSLYGGVVPEIASRAHTDAIALVVERAIKNAGITYDEIDAVAVTYGAGLLGALLVGVSFAKAFAYAIGKPLIAVARKRRSYGDPAYENGVRVRNTRRDPRRRRRRGVRQSSAGTRS